MKTRVIIGTSNFQTIQTLCKDSQEELSILAVVGYPGAGKTVGFRNYAENNKNVFLVKSTASMTAKHLYASILNRIGQEGNFSKFQLHELIKLLSYKLNSNSNNNLLIIDEAGKLNVKDLEFIHELKDDTENSTGIIISGPNYFAENLNTWNEDGVNGIPELHSRIDDWIYLNRPTRDEIISLCEVNGIQDKEFMNSLIKRSPLDFRYINTKINFFLKKSRKSKS